MRTAIGTVWAAGARTRTAAFLAVAATLALGIQIWAASPAGAHAVLLDTAPAEDEVVDGAPAEVELFFNESMQPPATISVTGPGEEGEELAVDDAAIDGEVVWVELDTLTEDGTYTVTWRAVSADDHPVEGEFTFEVSGAADEEATEEAEPGDDLEATEEAEPGDDLEATEEAEPGDDLEATEDPAEAGEPEDEATEDPAEDDLGDVDPTEPAVAEGDADGMGILPLLLAAAVLIAVVATGVAVLRQRKTGTGDPDAADERAGQH